MVDHISAVLGVGQGGESELNRIVGFLLFIVWVIVAPLVALFCGAIIAALIIPSLIVIALLSYVTMWKALMSKPRSPVKEHIPAPFPINGAGRLDKKTMADAIEYPGREGMS